MKVSIILTGRNDNYGGQFTERLTTTVRHNLDNLEAHGIDCQLILVEWNPPEDRELLAHLVTKQHPAAKCYVVDNLVHRHVSENKYIELFEYYAKNIGLSQAEGDVLLITNPDIAFGEDVLEFLAAGEIDPNTLYRVSFARIHDLAEIADAIPIDLDQEVPFESYSGDFICGHRSLFQQVGGFREDLPFTNTHKDALFCRSAYRLTSKAKKIGTVYHMEHERFMQGRRRIEFDVDRVSLVPQASFGLGHITELSEIDDRIYRVNLLPELQQAARDKVIPEPIVPRSVRKLPKLIRKFRNRFLQKSA